MTVEGENYNVGKGNEFVQHDSKMENEISIEFEGLNFDPADGFLTVNIEVSAVYEIGGGGSDSVSILGSVDLLVICPPAITGPRSIQECCQNSVTYCITNECSGDEFSWVDYPNGWQIVGGGVDQQCIEFIPNTSIGGTLRAEVRISSAVSSYFLEQDIVINRTAIPIQKDESMFPDYRLCPNEQYQFKLEDIGCNIDVNGYQWTFPSGWNVLAGQGTTSLTAEPTNTAVGGTVDILVTVSAGNGACSNQEVFKVTLLDAPPSVPIIFEGQFPPYSSSFHCDEWRMCNGEGEIRLFDFDRSFNSGTDQLEWTVTAPWSFAGGVNTMITGPQWASPTIYGPTFAPDGTLCVRAINCVGASLFSCVSFEWSNDYWCQSENSYPEWCECCAPPCDGCPNYQLNQGHPTDFMKSPIHDELDGELPESVELKLFPNPANGVVHLQRSDARAITGQIQIHTLQGVEVFRGRASSSLDLSGLPAGVYRVQLQTDFGRFSELLIVE
jgi:hypothetical protein